MKSKYDLVIVGAGPCGLAMAHCCSHLNMKILVIDREKTIGGCHRVIRKDGLFTEHGPRVYLSSYVNTFRMIKELGLDFYDVFTAYNHNSYGIVFDILSNISIKELWKLTELYIYFMMDDNYGTDINYLQYLQSNGFSAKMIDIFDRMFRLLDGASLSSYSVNKVMKVINTILIVSIYQPKRPLDEGLFNRWKSYLEARNIDFLLDSNITKINYADDKITSIGVGDTKIHLDKLVLAMPPASIVALLKGNDSLVKNCFGNFNGLQEWSNKTEYIDYVSITYHFKEAIDIPNVNGATLDTDWGIISINLSDYMKEFEPGYKKLLSVAITYTEKKSTHNHKTANECNIEELYEEVYRQIKASLYPNLPEKHTAVINPNNYYKNGKWYCRDKAYFNTIGTKYLKNYSDTISNIYNAGTHNGRDTSQYTIMESAVVNGMGLSSVLYPALKERYKITRPILNLKDYIFILLFVIIMLIILYLIYKLVRSK